MEKQIQPSTSKAPQICLLLLVAALIVMSLLCAHKYFVRQPTESPSTHRFSVLKQAALRNPEDISAQIGLAYAYQQANKTQLAKQYYQKALKLEKDNMTVLYNLGLLAQQAKDYATAEKYLNQVMQLKGNHVLGAIALGEIYIAKGEYDKAITVADKVIRVEYQLITPRLIKARALEAKGDLKRAQKEYQEVLRFVPDNQEASTALTRLK